MIVNQSTLTEQDVDFINALLRKQPRIIVLRIVAVLLGLFWLFTAGLICYLQIRYHNRSLSDMLLAAAFLIFAVLVLYRALFLRRSSHRTSLKYKSLFAPRTYTCDENGISAYHAYDGAEFNNRFAFEKVVCFYAREHSVVIRLGGEKNSKSICAFRMTATPKAAAKNCFHCSGKKELHNNKGGRIWNSGFPKCIRTTSRRRSGVKNSFTADRATFSGLMCSIPRNSGAFLSRTAA